MSYFKSGYFTPQYFNKYWQEEGEGVVWTVDANAAVSWGGQGGLPDEPVVQPPQVIGGGAASAMSRPLLRPWEAFEPTVLRARATITGTAAVEAVLSDPELSAKIAAQNAEVARLQEIDEDDQFVLSFVTAFLSEQNGCEINGFIS